jgi:signal peptidase I
MLNRRFWRDYIENILVAILLALLVRTFIWTGYRVPTSSMAPTLLPGDFIFAYRLPYGVRFPLVETKWIVNPPLRGEVVVFTFPDQPKVSYVKRVIGLPGDRVEIADGDLLVNGKKMEYERKSSPTLDPSFELLTEKAPEGPRDIFRRKEGGRKSFAPLIVPPNEVFLLGDNRDVSDDSRYWGTVPLERIDGRVQLIWLSLDWGKKWGGEQLPQVRKDRLFTRIR